MSAHPSLTGRTDTAYELTIRPYWQFDDDAQRRAPHLATAERMERDQGGRLTEFQARVFAAFLLGASKLPSDAADPDIVPDEARLHPQVPCADR